MNPMYIKIKKLIVKLTLPKKAKFKFYDWAWHNDNLYWDIKTIEIKPPPNTDEKAWKKNINDVTKLG
jgi:hypothetical protein